ncbi:regulatory GntR family protein [Nocardiopsis sp. Huas11]|uniref:GntR family transcriptional regulator n=1 Tax=Nocardiopsis sp. Huas11 TaxID=2183912 RepID=UPI000F27F52D|nr:GntR family transcriptional regulator [Nocardiopsis sp. Huas11]RKR98963.1 regulatory GntR family protein [Nocardiopsis sp. Huas11]
MTKTIGTMKKLWYMAEAMRREAMYERVARAIRTDIEAGRLRHGQVLPSTRELAAEWHTSVHTISEAMRLLVEDGKVVSKSRSQRVVHAPDHEEIRGEVHRLQKPAVILIGGYAGSGKSELARMVARETGWAVLDKDTLSRPLVEASLEVLGLSPHDRESDTYLSKVRPREYEALAAAIEEQLECGNSAIASAPFLKEFTDVSWIHRVQATCTALNAESIFVWVRCDPQSMHTYIRRRGAARDAAKLAAWDDYVSNLDLDFHLPVEHVVVENSLSSAPLQAQAAQLVKEAMKAR